MSSTLSKLSDDDGVAKRAGDLHHPVCDWWVKMLKERMEREKVSALALSKRVGCHDTAIGDILADADHARRPNESRLIPAICRAFPGLPLPSREVRPEVQSLYDAFMALGPKESAAILAAMKAMLGVAPQANPSEKK